MLANHFMFAWYQIREGRIPAAAVPLMKQEQSHVYLVMCHR